MKFIIGKKSDVSATSDRSIWLLLLTALVAAVFAFAQSILITLFFFVVGKIVPMLKEEVN